MKTGLLLTAVAVSAMGVDATARADEEGSLESEHQRLLSLLAEKSHPSTPYVVIDTQTNRLQLRNPETHGVEREVVCATGAARKLEGDKPRHHWHFATPKGRFSVLRKTADPMWIKPEWVFIEADEEIPIFAEDPRRFQRGVLGEYAMYFAKDYMIHGTLYEINLGNSITHGCVRVGTEDLQYLYDRVQTGWPVFIY